MTPLTPRTPTRRSIVDTPFDRTLRERHIERLTTLAHAYEDAAYEHAALGKLERHRAQARYEEYWAERTYVVMARVEAEPIAKALGF